MPFHVFLIVLSLLFSTVSHATAAQNQLKNALLQTEKNVKDRELHGDAIFLITQGAQLTGKSLALKPMKSLINMKDTFPSNIEYTLYQLRSVPLPSVQFTMPTKDDQFDAKMANLLIDSPHPQEVVNQDEGPWIMQILSNSLTCKPSSRPTTLVGEPNYEYISTHQTIGLIFARQRNCISRKDFADSIGAYALRIKNEFESASKQFTDIQIERAAVLCMIGQCKIVPDTFVNLLLTTQNKDGFWYATEDPLVNSGLFPPEHTTALAYYVLARKLTDKKR